MEFLLWEVLWNLVSIQLQRWTFTIFVQNPLFIKLKLDWEKDPFDCEEGQTRFQNICVYDFHSIHKKQTYPFVKLSFAVSSFTYQRRMVHSFTNQFPNAVLMFRAAAAAFTFTFPLIPKQHFKISRIHPTTKAIISPPNQFFHLKRIW